MAKLFSYEEKGTWMEDLCGVTKLIFFLAWTITCMLTYDTRVLAIMLATSLILFKLSRPVKQVGSVFYDIGIYDHQTFWLFLSLHRDREQRSGTEHILYSLGRSWW